MRRAARPSGVRPSLAPGEARRTRIGIIRANYNAEITSSLERKCVETLLAHGVPAANIERVEVPGCFEIPLAAQRLGVRKRFDALIALGAVIRGETHHFDLVANECARGVMDVMLRHNVPIIFEVLATYRKRDAIRRAASDRFNKGIEAAEAALAVIAALREIRR